MAQRLVIVLERGSAVCDVRGVAVGIVGTKGFESLHLAGRLRVDRAGPRGDRGLPAADRPTALRADDDDARGRAPDDLGLPRERPPRDAILEHRPHLVVHGHGHAGTFEGFVGPVPVFNVAVPLLGGRDFFVFELEREGRLVHAEAEPERAAQRAET
jgi:hypothetical protein